MKKKKYVNSGTVSMAPAPTSLLWNDSCFNYYESVGSLEEDAILCFMYWQKDFLIDSHITHQLIKTFG